jgi:hypothetical protein
VGAFHEKMVDAFLQCLRGWGQECHPQSDMDGIGWQFGNILSLPSWAGESCNAKW